MNNVFLSGRLTKDIELKTSSTGNYYTNFILAVKRNYSKDEVDFISCTAFNKTAELLYNYFQKGSALIVKGSINVTNSNDKYYTKVLVSNIEFMLNNTDNNKNNSMKNKQEFIDDDIEVVYDDNYPF